MNRSTHKATVLVVDDVPTDLHLISELLRDRYSVRIAISDAQALQMLEQAVPDLGVMMPNLDGYEVCRQHEDECLGLEPGATDYLFRPVNPPSLLARVKTQLRLKATTDLLRSQNISIDQEVVARTHELQAAHDATIQALASLAETHDNETGNHQRRTQYYVRALAEQLRHHPRFNASLDEQSIELMSKSARLHDIGKIGIPDQILRKPGRLEPAEFEIIKTHAQLGYQALVQAEELLGVQTPFLRIAKEIALCHHEKWDGSGYPNGLAGDAIPVGARIMAVADVYDAIISPRVYKPQMSHETAVVTICEGAGRHFDQDVVAAFMVLEQKFEQIAQHYIDADADAA